MERNRTLTIVTAATFLFGGCSPGENSNPDVTTSPDTSVDTSPLHANQPVYPTEEAANMREDACGMVEEDTEVPTAGKTDVGGWLVLKIATSDISDNLGQNDCPPDFVYATLK